MSLSSVRSALVTAFIASNAFDADTIAWENVAFTPPTDRPWAAVWFLPSQPTPGTLGPPGKGQDRVNGILQIDLNYPIGSGENLITDTADLINLTFYAGAYFTYNGQSVTIKSCGRGKSAVVNGFYKIPVTVYFYTFITR